MVKKMTARDVVDALRHDYITSEMVQEEWALLTEVPLSMMSTRSFAPDLPPYPYRNERTIDVLLLRNWGGLRSQSFERVAFEIKVSRSDYKNETDEKRQPAWANAHRCAYACPAGLITADELPEGWGLLWVYEGVRGMADGIAPTHRDWNKRCSWRRGATKHEPDGDDVRLLHYLARRASRLEERLRRGEDDAASLAALRVDVERLHARLANRDTAIARQRTRANEALQRLRAQGPQNCADCHEPVKVNLNGAHGLDKREDGFWKHADKTAGDRCRMARSERVRLEREQQTQTRYTHLRDYAPPIETEHEREERLREIEVMRTEEDAHNALTTDDDIRKEAHRG
jgi:hypothetical protein